MVVGWLVERSSWNACRQRSSAFPRKMTKLRKNGKNMVFFLYWRAFWMTSAWGTGLDDVSRTSSGDVAAKDRSTGAMRWRPSGRMRDEVGRRGDDARDSRTGTWTGQVSPYRAPSCTARNLSEGAPMEFGSYACPRVTSSSDRYRTISVGHRGPSEIHEDRWISSARSDGCRAGNMHGG
jgi:hypothetical protein